jgi:hypothetical protein
LPADLQAFTGRCATQAREPPDARTPAFVIAGHSALKTRVNALMTRQSIDLRKDFLQKRWMRGSSPRMTSYFPARHFFGGGLYTAASISRANRAARALD